MYWTCLKIAGNPVFKTEGRYKDLRKKVIIKKIQFIVF